MVKFHFLKSLFDLDLECAANRICSLYEFNFSSLNLVLECSVNTDEGNTVATIELFKDSVKYGPASLTINSEIRLIKLQRFLSLLYDVCLHLTAIEVIEPFYSFSF